MRFFKLLDRNFSKLVKLNLVFFLPAFVIFVCCAAVFLFDTHWVMRFPDNAGSVQFSTWRLFSYPRPSQDGGVWLDVWGGFMTYLPLVALAPFTAGLAFVTRKFVQEEYVFIWSDFWQAVKDNWKMFLLNGTVCYLFYVGMTISIFYYYNLSRSHFLYHVPLWICVMLALLFLFAQFYLPVMFVTFDLTFGKAYRNAFIFAIVGLGRNLLLAAVLAIALFLFYISFLTFNFVIFLPLCVLFLFSFLSFLVNFMVYPIIDRYLIKK